MHDTTLQNPSTETVGTVFCKKQDKTLYMRYYINYTEQRAISKEAGDSAVLLYQYYLRMASVEHPVITDKTAADTLGWSERKVQENRLRLVKMGLYKEYKYKRPNGTYGVEYHIGEAAVEDINRKRVK